MNSGTHQNYMPRSYGPQHIGFVCLTQNNSRYGMQQSHILTFKIFREITKARLAAAPGCKLYAQTQWDLCVLYTLMPHCWLRLKCHDRTCHIECNYDMNTL